MAKLNWSPWMGLKDLGLEGLKDEMDAFVEEFFSHAGVSEHQNERGRIWSPKADMFETPAAITIQADLPGVRLEDIVLEVRDKELLLYGNRRFEKDVEGSVYQMLERSYGPFARKFPLPRDVDPDAIQAVYKNGLLTVTIPKENTEETGRKIRIRVR